MNLNTFPLFLFAIFSSMFSSFALLRSPGTTLFRRATIGRSLSGLAAQVKSMSVTEFGKILKNPETRPLYQIIDVRSVSELEVSSIQGSDIINLPLNEAERWSQKVESGALLDSSKPTICLCHHGMRSLRVAQFLTLNAGFEDVYNVEGGIHQYAVQVDPNVPTY